MNTIVVGNYRKEIYPFEHDFFNVNAYPNFILDEFKLIYEDDFFGKVKTIVKVEKPEYTHEKVSGHGYDYWIGLVRLINYSDELEEPSTFSMTYASEDGVNYDYCGCNGDNYDRGQNIDNIMRCIMLRLENREKTTKEITHKILSSEKQVKKKNIPENKKVFLFGEICDYFYLDKLSGNMQSREIVCPCWSVRGHYRHYKSGKVIFVKEYKKGKERANTEPKDKTYTV